jgi:uncharacterized membrane protein (UPF0127 family)
MLVQSTTGCCNSVVAAALSVFFCMMMAMLAAPALGAGFREDRLTLVTTNGRHEIEIEVAETSEQKAKGLMFRTHLAANRGMLFPYGSPQEITMWMRNTYIPLDMVFIKADGTVHRIEARTEPLSEKIIPSRGAVVAVLELAGGVAEKLGLKPGDKVLHRTFGTAP